MATATKKKTTKKTATKTATKKVATKKATAKKAPAKKVVSKKAAALSKLKNNRALTLKEVSIKDRLTSNDGDEILVKIRDMDVIFGKGNSKIHAVRDVNLNIYKGEVLGLVGESGSGKSTTGNALLGLVDRANGSITLKDREIPAKTKNIKGDIHSFMVNKVQMIFQDPASSLNPYKNIYKIVSEGLKHVDVRQVFAKTFDGVTATTLASLLKNKKQPASIANVTLKWINNQIEQNDFEKVINVLYRKVIDDLYAMKKAYADEAAAYLRMRWNIRREYTEGTDSRKKIEKKLVIDIVNSVGLSEDILGRYPLEFSGGQQQRVGISRAVVLKPELIVADEPISALDVSIQAQVVNIFNDLKEKLNLTILFIAHDLRMVEYISDRIAVMYKGELLEIGDAKEIIQNPVHPYTRSLVHSIPTIDKVNQSLLSKAYDPNMHDYKGEMPGWISIINGKIEHYVKGSKEEVRNWLDGKYE